ncbi:unnamed protein product [Pedinophyceae sp. YPF-701]|nr:unnamed protein product [Pedinophyceae sp. YPF-701]
MASDTFKVKKPVAAPGLQSRWVTWIAVVAVFWALPFAFMLGRGDIGLAGRYSQSAVTHVHRQAMQGEEEATDRKNVALEAVKDPDEPPEKQMWLGREDLDDQIEERAKEIMEKGIEGYYLSGQRKNPCWFLQLVLDDMNRDTGVVAMSSPFEDAFYDRAMCTGFWWELKKRGVIMIGVSSYEEWPGEIVNPYDSRFVREDLWEVASAMEGWLHMFRPELKPWLPQGVPRILMSESDFVHSEWDGLRPGAFNVEYDMVYVNRVAGADWNVWNRNWTLAQESFVRLINEADFKIASIDRPLDQEHMDRIREDRRDNYHVIGDLAWGDWLGFIQKCRMLFVPNVHDASPRVITEAMSVNRPVLMNWYIVGGWKYIEESTGEFFYDEDDVVAAATRLKERFEAGKTNPRRYVEENIGYRRSGARLRAFLELAVGPERLKNAKRDAIKHGLRPMGTAD